MNEKDLLNKIKDHADNITPPDSLHPDAIEKMLLKHTQQEKEANAEPEHRITEFAPKRKARKKTFHYAVRYGSLAAVCVLAVTAAWQTNRISKLSGEVDSAKLQVKEDAAESELFEADKASGKTGLPAADSSSAKTALSAADSSSAEASEETCTDALSYAKNYEEIYNALQELSVDCDTGIVYESVEARTLFSKEAAADTASEAAAGTSDIITSDSAASSAVNEKDFSDTNVQETGVDEADIIKTDGEYIYILRRDCTLAIVKADGADSEKVSVTSVGDSNSSMIQEMYLDGDTLNVLTTQEITSLENASSESTEDIYYTETKQQTVLYTYDISSKTAPKLTGTVTQEGFYSDSRKVGPYLYLFTSYYPDVKDTYGESTIIPRINGTNASASDFYLPEELTDTAYLVISSVDTANPGEVLDSKILVSGASTFYVSTENIYIANETYNGRNTNTEITKFHYADGNITGVAAASVKGYLNDSFSMNEYDGNLRIVTTYYGNSTTAFRDAVGSLIDIDISVSADWEEHNGLFILDKNMQHIGSVEDLAPGETIRSARFLGDTGYFVTFRQTDPLFSVDLSDPANPQILGELKISGFSSYLHFYGENLLLGIGYEADETTGITTGLKLSMFDVSDPANVTEINRLILPGMTWCPAIENYKSILVNPQKNLIGFFCDNRYLTFSWDRENGFSQELVYDFYSDMLMEDAGYDTVRGLYIEDTLYVAGENFLAAFDMKKEFEKIGVLAI